MKDQNFTKIQTDVFKKKPEVKQPTLPYEVSGVTIHVPYEYAEKLKDLSYWEGDTLKDIALQALIEYLDKKQVQPRPEKVRNKKKPGRKVNTTV
jgi:hypothetical protein